jgi:nitrite reductase/ring-hydroxylating ferredoxin subunit
LREEAEAAQRLGLPANFTQQIDLPFPIAGAVRFDGQAQFDPHRYLIGLAKAISGKAAVFENSRATEIEHGEPCILRAGDATVTAADVVIATQMPVTHEGVFYAKAFPLAHPIAAARIDASRAPAGMSISIETPSHSLRTAERNGETFLIAAGGEFKPGDTEGENEMVADLRNFLREHFGVEQPDHLWTNEDFRPMDGLPYIGKARPSKPRLHVATGFNAWGITTGTLAAKIIADAILGRPNADAEIFDATRIRPIKSGPRFVSGNAQAGMHLIGDRLLKRQVEPLDQIPPGEGGIIEIGGEQLAVMKHKNGEVTALSAVCTHLGCIVGWNSVDRSWDCPCHGSRFDEHGEVLCGPAVAPLQRKSIGAHGEKQDDLASANGGRM